MDRTVDVSTLDPDYVNENNAGRIVGLVGTFHFLALGFVCLRIYARAALVKAFSIDDGLIIVVVVSHDSCSAAFLSAIAQDVLDDVAD